ncbi:MAG: hypothetical protein J4432_05130 [DPANN group archaeon]|nr:hypothetical protein [DPANN group archaeon]
MIKETRVKIDLRIDLFLNKIVTQALNIAVLTGLALPFISTSTWRFEFDQALISNDKYIIFIFVLALLNYLWHRQHEKAKAATGKK